MRDFKMKEDPDILPEGLQLDDPFATEFIPEILPGTFKEETVIPADSFELPIQEAAFFEEPAALEELPLEEEVYEELPLEEEVYEEIIPEETLYEEMIPEEEMVEAPMEEVPTLEMPVIPPVQEEPAPVFFDEEVLQPMYEEPEEENLQRLPVRRWR